MSNALINVANAMVYNSTFGCSAFIKNKINSAPINITQ